MHGVSQGQGFTACFRNQTLNDAPFTYDPNQGLPETGTLEFDFVYLLNPPHESEQISDDDLERLMNYIRSIDAGEKLSLAIEEKINVFKTIAEHVAFNSEQLGQIINVIDNPIWQA